MPAGLVEAIGRASHLLASQLDDALVAYNLSFAKLGLLQILAQAANPVPLGQLAERLSCVKSNITQLVDRLEADGLVKRVQDAQDRRVLRAAITSEGLRRYAIGAQVKQDLERQLLQDFSSEEALRLVAVLEKLGTKSPG